MKTLLCLALTLVCALAAPATLEVQREAKKIIPILKQINQLNDDGSYTFGYESGDGSFRVETKDINGFTKGRYGYIGTDGKSQVLEYISGKESGSSVGFVPSGTLVPVPIVRAIPSAEQRALDYQYSSVDADEDGIPDNKASGPVRVIVTPSQQVSIPVSAPVVQQPNKIRVVQQQFVPQQQIVPQQQFVSQQQFIPQQQFFQPAFIRTSPAVIVRQPQQPIRQQFINQDLQFQSVDVNEDGIPDSAIPASGLNGFPIFGGRII